MTDESPKSFNPGRWSVRGLVLGSAIASSAGLACLGIWGDPTNAIHVELLSVCKGIIYADLAAFTGGALGEAVAGIWRK